MSEGPGIRKGGGPTNAREGFDNLVVARLGDQPQFVGEPPARLQDCIVAHIGPPFPSSNFCDGVRNSPRPSADALPARARFGYPRQNGRETMPTRRLGRTDLSIAPIVLGGNVFGWTADKAASFAVLDRFAAARARRDRHGRRLFVLGARQSRRRVRDDHRRMDEGARKPRPRHPSSPRSARRWARARRACRRPISSRRSKRR